MIADLPPIPQCVATMADVKYQSIVIMGKALAVRTFLDQKLVKEGSFEISLSQEDDDGNLTAILRLDINTPYRMMGGLIYTAQTAGLQIGGWAYQPPLCHPDKRSP
jgi:hypothetical protein